MRVSVIQEEVQKLKDKYQTSNLTEICNDCGISVLLRPMGSHEKSCKGFFLVNARCKVIVLNSDLPDCICRVILAHELGHAILHGINGISAYHEFAMLNETDRMEYEANLFAAELLLDDNAVNDAILRGDDLFTTSSYLEVPPELLEFKLRIMQRYNKQMQIPMYFRADFLKRDIGKRVN